MWEEVNPINLFLIKAFSVHLHFYKNCFKRYSPIKPFNFFYCILYIFILWSVYLFVVFAFIWLWKVLKRQETKRERKRESYATKDWIYNRCNHSKCVQITRPSRSLSLFYSQHFMVLIWKSEWLALCIMLMFNLDI